MPLSHLEVTWRRVPAPAYASSIGGDKASGSIEEIPLELKPDWWTRPNGGRSVR